MKIAVVRGDFLSGWELPIFEPWLKNHEVTLFLGKKPIYNVSIDKRFKVERLFCPVDLCFGKVRRWQMAILNRVFVDAHFLFGLEEKLKGFDVAYTAETFYNFSRQCIRAKKKGYIKAVVMHVGENIAFNNEGIWGRKELKQEVMAGTDKFIAITDQARKVLIQEGADPSKIVRADPGVDLTRFKPRGIRDIRDMGEMRGKRKIRLLTVGRLVAEKGIAQMVRVFRGLRGVWGVGVELVVVGKGPLETLLHTPGITHIPSLPHKDMPALYNSCDIYVHYPVGNQTWAEQWGFVLAEAMACGLPVVALNRGSVGEVLKDAGYLVDSQKEFQDTLEKLIANKNLRRKTKKIIYDVRKFSAQVERVLYEAVNCHC